MRHRFALTATLLAGICTVAVAQGTDKKPEEKKPEEKKLDRSGEAILRKLFESAGKLTGLEVFIRFESRSRADKPYLYDKTGWLRYKSGSIFRWDEGGHFGDARRVICDGKTYLFDSMTDGAKVQLRNAGKSIIDSGTLPPGAASGGGPRQFGGGGQALLDARASNPLLAVFLSGSDQFDRFVSKETAITEVNGEQGMKGVRFNRRTLGWVTAYYLPTDPQMLIRRIEVDQGLGDTGGAETFGGGNFNRQDIYYTQVGANFPPSLFSTVAVKGIDVDDRRKAKPGEFEEEERETGEKD